MRWQQEQEQEQNSQAMQRKRAQSTQKKHKPQDIEQFKKKMKNEKRLLIGTPPLHSRPVRFEDF